MSNTDPHGDAAVLTAGAAIGTAKAGMVMVHGRGANAADILSLSEIFERPDIAYFAPEATGHTWYPRPFTAPVEQNEPYLGSALRTIAGLLAGLARDGVLPERIVLLGFSQGACLCSTAAQRRPARYAGVIVYSGGLIGPPGTTWAEAGDFAGTPAFFGCSNVDGHIPEERVLASAALYERMGATVTTRIYPWMGHLVNDDEIAFTRALLEELVAR